MELNKNHREALINELEKAKEDLGTQTRGLQNAKAKTEDNHLIEWFEIGMFLAEQRIILIEKSLINNEIDF